ncbi:isoprenyl transferase [bacterium]|nr:isoprenyl transferase [bacterium]
MGTTVTATDYVQECGLETDRLPRHVAIIMDGNGRWAQRRGLPRIEGHRQGVHSVRRITEEACRLGLEQITLYCLSVENWKRPKRELDLLMELLEIFMVEERETIMRNNVQLKVIGRRDGLPDSVQARMDETIAMSASNTGTVLCLAINYGGRTEMVDAVKSIAQEVRDGKLTPDQVDEKLLSDHLYTREMSDPDLLIRTAGERRVSNFLLWQISYAEIWITPVHWPDFDIIHLHQALQDFTHRERRFGGLIANGSDGV